MGQLKQGPSAGKGTKDRTSPWIGGIIVVAMVLGACGACGTALFSRDDSAVEMPSTSDGQALARELAKAYDVQRVCYGWRLQGTSADPAAGSNLGGGVALDLTQLPPQCDRAVHFVARVTYTSPSSELDDYATVSIRTVNVDLPSHATADLARFGVAEKELIEDPVATLARAMLALPLLVAEYDLAPSLPRPSSSGTATGAAPPVGSDFMRDRGWLLVVAIVLLLCAPLGVFLGFGSRRRTEDRRRARARSERHVRDQRRRRGTRRIKR